MSPLGVNYSPLGVIAPSRRERSTRKMTGTPNRGVHRSDVVAEPRRPRVLVIDDEELLARALGRALSPDYDTVICSGAQSALDLLARGLHFDAILCDLAMPDMNGMDLHAELSKIAPDVAAEMIFLTGGATTERARDFLTNIPNERLQKPFDTRRLLELVRERVGRAAPAK